MPTKFKSIYNVDAVKTFLLPKQIYEIATFLAKNRNTKLTPQEMRMILTTKTFATTPINTLFNRILETGKTQQVSFIRVPQKQITVPEALTFQFVPVDIKQASDVSPNTVNLLASVPEFHDNIVINITSMIKRTGELVDVLTFQSRIVRDLLSRSYYLSQKSTWLTPSLIQFMCKCYNMSLSNAISSTYGLDFFEQKTIATIFAYYYLQNVMTPENAKGFMKSNNKIGLPSAMEVQEVLDLIDSVHPDKTNMRLSFDEIVGVIPHIGIDRLSNINKRIIYSKLGSLGIDISSSAIAIEYPPYFAHLILYALSGRKIGMMNILKTNGLMKEATQFVTDLVSSPIIFQDI